MTFGTAQDLSSQVVAIPMTSFGYARDRLFDSAPQSSLFAIYLRSASLRVCDFFYWFHIKSDAENKRLGYVKNVKKPIDHSALRMTALSGAEGLEIQLVGYAENTKRSKKS